MVGAMAEWSDWFKVIKETGPGRKYLYLQRVKRVPGRKSPLTQNRSLGRINGNPQPRQRKPYASSGGIGLAVFGVEDEYGERRDSLWNRTVNKEPAKAPEPEQEKAPDIAEGSDKGAGAGNSEEPSE